VTLTSTPIPTADVDLIDRLANPTDDEVAVVVAWWRANNYLTVGLLDRRDPLRIVTLHLGNGCSATAVLNGVCSDTTME